MEHRRSTNVVVVVAAAAVGGTASWVRRRSGWNFLAVVIWGVCMTSTATVAFSPSSFDTQTITNNKYYSTTGSNYGNKLKETDATTTGAVTRLSMHNKKTTRGGGGGFAGAALQELQKKTFPYAGPLRPGKQSVQRVVEDKDKDGNASLVLVKPDYWQSGVPLSAKKNKPLLPWMIEVKTADEIVKMRAAGALARHVLDMAGRLVAPGITTDFIDSMVHAETIKNGAYPSPLNYHGFPKSCCTSVNEVICHGIPDDRPLVQGDIINLDITVYLNGYHGDCSEMFVVGSGNNEDDAVDDATQRLLQATYDCWISACQFVLPGRDYKDIGAIIEDHVTPRNFSTVRQFCGHGVGATFHTNPNILHYRNSEPNGQMVAGHTFTIEPMICEGSARALTWPDEWTATTADGLRSAQFEHTLLITDDGVEALTGKTANSPLQFWERNSEVHKGIWLGTSANAIQRQNEINAVLLKQQS